ncbi:MAG: pantetheine-phosphate adenylyltransferase [Marinilabiliales bacterium]|nr:MAG: pantetheine-phosphate adenylyltransferase [Marinilabiliales bacterium]
MEKIAVFPGTFDPFTVGHESVVNRAQVLFDKIYIAVGFNPKKDALFSLEDRKKFINQVFNGNPIIEVVHFEGLTIEFCKKIGAKYILRGLRTAADFEYERAIAQVNKAMYEGIETVFFLTMPEHTPINSSIVRDIVRHGGDVSKFIPSKMSLK